MKGTAKVTEQVEAQFLGDGVHVELTPGYHIEAVYACNKLYNMAQVNNKVGYFPTNYVGLLKKAARLVMDIAYLIILLIILMIQVPVHGLKVYC